MKTTDIGYEEFEEVFNADANAMFLKTNYVEIPREYNFGTEFPTWIIAYCPDTDSWFVTNQRFFYYEHNIEFESEKDGIDYFRNNIPFFFELTNKLSFKNYKNTRVFLENTKEEYRLQIDFNNVLKLNELKLGNKMGDKVGDKND